MCGNVAGFILKPGLIYRALKNKNRVLLPAFWMQNPKAWLTKVLTEYWFHQGFIPQVRQYLDDLDKEFKVLLIIDNGGGHPLDLYYKGVQLEFLPPNTTSLLWPMDQGVILAFEALYIGNSLQQLVDAMDHDSFSPQEIQHSAINKAVQLVRILGGEGFDDIIEDEVSTPIDAHTDPLTD
ncbi:tigger transposable element-derived protein 1-like [Macrobrachium nipponense]|uniref:tigger transposable element-derived protein 1-like n=1 Tax=Macrobrachium nipponense TaxID=159736 RepID=UPI0030C89D8A